MTNFDYRTDCTAKFEPRSSSRRRATGPASQLAVGKLPAISARLLRDHKRQVLEQANREVCRLLKQGLPVSVADTD
jgi:hypothetical protein